MKKIVQVAAALVLVSLFSSGAHASKAGDFANVRARALIQRMKTTKLKKPITVATPLLNFSSSPAQPLQNQTLSWVVQFDNPFTNRELSIEVKNNGVNVADIQSPYKGMFLVSLGLQTEARAQNTLEATLFAEDPQTNVDVRNAVKALDTEIKRLTTQSNAERDPAKRAILQAQRQEKIALKNELLTQLKKFRFKLGTQSHSYSIVADSGSETLPKITSISPVFGNVRGGTLVTISGQNFSSSVSVLIGGLPSPSVTFVNSTTVQAISPDFEAGVGGKDVELRFSSGGQTTNVISKNAFFAANIADATPGKPVAIATGSLRVDLGETALLDGTESYSNTSSSLGYTWTVASAPSTSNYTVGQVVGTSPTASVSPSAYGTYVFSLSVRDIGTQDELVSEPSIVVIQVDGGPQPVANPITVPVGESATTRVIANDPTPGEGVTFSILEQPEQGSASISSAGIATYNAGPVYVGPDSFVVRVSDQSGHHADLTISVLVVNFSRAPSPYADPIATHSEPGSTQVHANDPDLGQTFSYEIIDNGDHGNASINASGFLTYQSDSGYVGPDSVSVRVTDSAQVPLSGIAVINIAVAANSVPQISAPNIFIVGGASGTSQASVVDDAGQTGSYSVSNPSHGTASVSASGLLTYTPGGTFTGNDSFVVGYTDNGNPALTGTTTISVEENVAPSASAPPISVQNAGSGTSQISVSDPNIGQTFSYQITTPPAHGAASVSGSGLVTFTSNSSFAGSVSLVVTVSDSGTPALSTTVEIPVSIAANHAPTASAPPITVGGLGTETSLISAFDEDTQQALSYVISTEPNNGTASVSASGLVTFQSTANVASTSSIGVTISDNGFPNLSTTISIPVEVTYVNQPPVIPDNVAPNTLGFTIRSQGVPYSVTMGLGFGATELIHDPDGTIVSAVWTFGDGTQEATSAFDMGTIMHNFMAPGDYTATLVVTDNLGASTSKQLVVSVVDTDIPTAKFTVSPSNGGGGGVPLTVTFNASASSDADGITQYRWRFGNTNTEVVTTNPVITRTFNNPGQGPGNTIGVRLRTRDAYRAQGESTVNVTVGATSTGAPMQAQFSVGPPREVVLGTAHAFNGSRSFNPNIGGSIVGWNWNFGDLLTCPNPNGGCTGTGVAVNYTYPAVGVFFPSLRVQNPGGNISGAAFSHEVFVVNEGHAPRAIAKSSVVSGVAPLSVNFSGGESYDYDGTIANHTWHFGDSSSPETGANVSHIFQNPGFYNVRMDLQDDDGNVVAVTLETIEVTASYQPRNKRTVSYDPEREYQRQVLAGACREGSGEACSQLADMYLEDERPNVAQHFKERACLLGYAEACERR